MVGSGRLNRDVLADIAEAHVAKAVKRQPDGTISRMLFLCIEGYHHAADKCGVAPSEPASDHIRFKTSVPHQRAWWIWRTRDARKEESLTPDALGLFHLSLVDECFQQRIGFAQLKFWVKSGQPGPDSQSLIGLFLSSQGGNQVQVSGL